MTPVWTISAMDCYPQVGSETDVVFVCHWTCAGTQTTDGKDYSASVYSTCSVPTPTGEAFTPFADLTQSQVLSWIWGNGVDQAATEAAVQQQIDLQITPVVVTPPLPWVSVPVTA